MRISDWSSDVCSSDLCSTSPWPKPWGVAFARPPQRQTATRNSGLTDDGRSHARRESPRRKQPTSPQNGKAKAPIPPFRGRPDPYRRLRSEEHTSELQSLMRISYAVFCLKKKKTEANIIVLTHKDKTTA